MKELGSGIGNMNIWCRFGIHKWGHEHWGQMRLNVEKGGADILTIERARKHWKDLETVRRKDKNDE